MCTPNQIRLYFVAVNALKFIFALYLLGLSITVLSTKQFRMAYGTYFEGTGVGIFMLALLGPMNAAIGHSGAQRHNKFLLLTNAVFDLILMLTQLGLAVTLLDAAQVSYIAPEFDVEVREGCLMKYFSERDDEVCNAYISSDRYAGMKLAWYSFFLSSDANHLRELEKLRREGECCGFGQIENCEWNRNGFPPDRSPEDVSSFYLKNKVMCGTQPSWYYQATKYCRAADMGVADPTQGCICEFPIGGCCAGTTAPPVFFDEQKGCASAFDVWMGQKIEDHGVFMLMCMVLQLINMAVACCYCMKRRSDDVMPDYLATEPWDPYGKDGIMTGVDPYNEDAGGAGGAAEGES